MTFFNVRLGWWLGNPGEAGNGTYNRWYPTWSPQPIIEEALGATNDTNPYIYLSDGGHFENLAIYEMVLRRCRVIVAGDAGADPTFTFEDLGNMVRKVRIDLGIPIEFEPGSPLFDCNNLENRPADAKARFALARIRYSAIDQGQPDGMLIYIKPVVYGAEEPRDVVQYWRSSPTFPHETTLDQFFSESQFESYRELGLFTLEEMGGPGPAEMEPDQGTPMDHFLERVFQHGTPRSWAGVNESGEPLDAPQWWTGVDGNRFKDGKRIKQKPKRRAGK
jgi:hypothetical protein